MDLRGNSLRTIQHSIGRARASFLALAAAFALQISPAFAQKDDSAFWLGTWQLSDSQTQQALMMFTIKEGKTGLHGTYRFTSNLCQKKAEERASFCPFQGVSGTFTSVEAKGAFFSGQGPDPFYPESDFDLTMMSSNGKTVDVSALRTDLLFAEFITKATKIDDMPSTKPLQNIIVTQPTLVVNHPITEVIEQETSATAAGSILPNGEWFIHYRAQQAFKTEPNIGRTQTILDALASSAVSSLSSEAFPHALDIKSHQRLSHISASINQDILVTPTGKKPFILNGQGESCIKKSVGLERALAGTGKQHIAWFTGGSCQWNVISGQALKTQTNARKKTLRLLDPAKQFTLGNAVLAETPDGSGTVIFTQNQVWQITKIDQQNSPNLATRLSNPLTQFLQHAVTTGGTEPITKSFDVPKVGKPLALIFNPSSFYAGEKGAFAPSGFVLIGEKGFVARGVDKVICDALVSLTRFTSSQQYCDSTTDFEFRQDRPKVTVLLHGLTGFPEIETKQTISKSNFAAYYWGYDFMQGILGQTSLHKTQGFSLVRPNIHDNSLHHTPISFRDWTDCVDDYKDEDMRACRRNHVLAAHPKETPVFINQPILQSYSQGYFEAVMVPNRNGTPRLKQQMLDAGMQICESYEQHFSQLPISQQPQLYFFAHSFGGNVSRGILSGVNPAQGQSPAKGVDSQKWQQCQHLLRTRTVSLTTLSSPHEGSPTPFFAVEAEKAALLLLNELENKLNSINTQGNPVAQAHLTNAKKEFESLKKGLLDVISADRPATIDIANMRCLNGQTPLAGVICEDAGLLSPDKMNRPDGSLIPVYTMAGRNPGGGYLTHPNQAFDVFGFESSLFTLQGSGRRASEAMKLFLVDRLSRLFKNKYSSDRCKIWGQAAKGGTGDAFSMSHAGTGYFCEMSAQTDTLKVKVNRLLASIFAHHSDGFLVPRFGDYTNLNGDGEFDADGFVGFDSAHGLGLKGKVGGNWYRLHENAGYGYRQPWDWDNHGSEAFNPGTAWWFRHAILTAGGPIVSNKRVSTWDTQTDSPIYNRSVNVTIKSIRVRGCDDIELPFIDQSAELSVEVDIGGVIRQWDFPENSGDIMTPRLTILSATGPVVPIKIRIWDRDDVAIGMRGKEGIGANVDDTCVVSNLTGRSDLYLYYDLETGIIHGDRIRKQVNKRFIGEYRYPQKTDFVIHGSNKTASARVSIKLNISQSN